MNKGFVFGAWFSGGFKDCLFCFFIRVLVKGDIGSGLEGISSSIRVE